MKIDVEIVSLNQPWTPPALPRNEVVLRIFGREAVLVLDDDDFSWLVQRVAEKMKEGPIAGAVQPARLMFVEPVMPVTEESPLASLRDDLDPPQGPIQPVDPLEGLRRRAAAPAATPSAKPPVPQPVAGKHDPFENQG